MGNLRRVAFGGAHYCDDIQTDLKVDAFRLDIVVDGLAQMLQLPVVDGLFGFLEHSVATGLDFHKDNGIIEKSDDVEILVAQLPVTLNDGIAFLLKEIGCQLLTLRSKFVMCCHNLFFFAC